MGRNSGLQVSILISALFGALFYSNVFAATQVKLSPQPLQKLFQTAESAIGLPYGDAAFFGPEFVSEHTAGNRFRADSITGVFPPGAAPKVKVPVKPVLTVNPTKLATSVVQSIKGGGVPGLLATAAVVWAIDQIPGASVDSGQLVVLNPGEPLTGTPPQGSTYGWNVSGGTSSTRRYDPVSACVAAYPVGTWLMHQTAQPPTQMQVREHRIVGSSSDSVTCLLMPQNQAYGAIRSDTILRSGSSCPTGSIYSDAHRSCVGSGGSRPFEDSDYAALSSAIALVTSSDWLRDLTKAKCNGSLSPEGCYQDLVDRRPYHGPASQTTPSNSTTTTKTNPDGTISTTVTTTQNKYDYTYTQNGYTYRTTTTTTTTTDGQTTTEVVEDTSDPSAPPDEEPAETSEDQDYSFDDSEFPEVQPFYEQKYPDGLRGVWTSSRTEFESSAFFDFLNSFIPSFSGSCPSWSMSFNIASWANYGNHSFLNLCYVFDFVKVVLLVTALFTARAITFGG